MNNKIKCRVLTGLTASGKTDLSLLLAERNGWEIACMDSMQVYRGMDIGTAKPTAEEQKRVKHHLLDICDPKDTFSVAMYRESAEKLIVEKWEKEGKEILFVGGTGLYLAALMHPMGMGMVPADETLREELRILSETPDGKKALHQLLRELDPLTADHLPENDIRRTIRAIEVSKATGVPFSKQPPRVEESPFSWCVAALDVPREMLYQRINRRVESMIQNGLPEEVRSLLQRGVSPSDQSMQAIGYKEMIPFLNGEQTIEKTTDEIKKRTRHYAKRQATFLRREKEIRYLNFSDQDLLNQAEEYFQNGGSSSL